MNSTKKLVAASTLLLGVTHANVAHADGPDPQYLAYDNTDVRALCSDYSSGLVDPGFGWDMGTVHGTNDWVSSYTTSSVSVSFRSCDWMHTSHDYAFRCHGAYSWWDMQLVRGDKNWRDYDTFSTQACNDTDHNPYWDNHPSGNWRIHFHLHSNAPTVDPDDCPDQTVTSKHCVNDIKVYQFKASMK